MNIILLEVKAAPGLSQVMVQPSHSLWLSDFTLYNSTKLESVHRAVRILWRRFSTALIIVTLFL